MSDRPTPEDPAPPAPSGPAKPRRDLTRETLTFPPRGRSDRHSRVVFGVFALVAVLIVALALYVTFGTDRRDQVVDAFATETAEIYNTAATHSTATAAARGTGVPADVVTPSAPASPAPRVASPTLSP